MRGVSIVIRLKKSVQRGLKLIILIPDRWVIPSTSAMGRATLSRLDMNDELHNDAAIVEARSAWVQVGWHPPQDISALCSRSRLTNSSSRCATAI
jgi:hypothetical protein